MILVDSYLLEPSVSEAIKHCNIVISKTIKTHWLYGDNDLMELSLKYSDDFTMA